MSWSKSRAEARIRKFMETAPVITVERYEDEYIPRFHLIREAARLRKDARAVEAPPLFGLPDGAAVLVDTVQVYVRALNYDDIRLDHGRETEASHARGLAFLSLLYSAADRVVENADCQRVDHHGARMHAVVIEPRGPDKIRERIAAGLRLAEDMMELARSAGSELFPELGGDLKFRVGIDLGPCIAINSGRKDEREPMFVGSSANHAAKLAAGNSEGVYISDRVRAALAFGHPPMLNETIGATPDELSNLRRYSIAARDSGDASRRLDEWRDEVKANTAKLASPADFQFHHHTPPLRSIDYAALSASRSIRMPLVSIFADLDRYTAFIDRCMAEGRLADAVRMLHILRSEFAAVLQDDFGGRKVRFVGDCVHGLIAEGTSHETDKQASVTLAAKCAGALRSSFKLCQMLLPEAHQLGLAIGFELGPTPVSRIGIRGERAVRTATSLAVRASQRCQELCSGTQTMIGTVARSAASAAIQRLFPSHVATDLTFDDVATQVDAKQVANKIAGAAAILTSPVVAAEPARAYSK